MIKSNKSKKGGFFSFFSKNKSNKNKSNKSNKNNKNIFKKIVTLDGNECWEQHNVWQLQVKNKKCNCYCLSKDNKKINKKLVSDNYNECSSGNIMKKKDKQICESGKYLWSSDKSKSFPVSKKCAGNRSCWGK